MNARELALGFFEALNRRDVAAALCFVDAAAAVDVVPAGLRGSVSEALRPFLESVVKAFPDLFIQVKSSMGTADFAAAEIKFEGTQAEDFLGVVNQEKHLDVDQAWLFRAEAGRITSVRAYWCQNQLYRRLAVKRLDRVSILG